jgi:hypothetical protein
MFTAVALAMRNIRRRMMGFSVGGWEDKVDPNRVRMDLVEDFEAFISDNALCGKGGPAESRQLLVLPETAPQKPSAKRSASSETGNSDTPSTNVKWIESRLDLRGLVLTSIRDMTLQRYSLG